MSKEMRLTIEGDKTTLIKALEALQHAKIDVVGVKVGSNGEKLKKDDDEAYKLAEAYDDKYEGKIK